MKILLLAAAKDIHGVRWANKLSEHGNEVHLVFVSNHGPYQDKINKKVILHELKYSAPLGYYLNIFELKKLIRNINPDIMNAHFASGYGTIARLSNFKPLLLSVYGKDVYEFPYVNKHNNRIIQKNLKKATAIASTSNSMAIQVTKLVPIDIKNIFITPFGVDLTKFKPERKNKSNDSIFTIGSIKKLESKYGIEYGILAINYLCKELLDKGINIRYEIYGEGSKENELKELVKKNDLDDIISFHGRIPNDEVPKALNDMDVFLGTSVDDSESFGVAIVEAMACGVPVIVSDVDGFKEVVENGSVAPMVKRKDYKKIAEVIKKFIYDKEFYNNICEKEISTVKNKYDWEKNVKYMEGIYLKLIDNTRL